MIAENFVIKEKYKFCADDWGLSPGVNAGILKLAKLNLLYSVSIMANSQYLENYLSELLELKNSSIKFYLHFNLTYDQKKENSKNFSKFFILKALSGFIDENQVQSEFRSQLKKLESYDIPITGLDGHHHIHLIPKIYKSIEKEINNSSIHEIRLLNDKEHILTYLQSYYFKNYLTLSTEQISYIDCGYLLPKNIVNKNKMRAKIEKFSKIIIHPAEINDFLEKNISDKLRSERVEEFNALMDFYK